MTAAVPLDWTRGGAKIVVYRCQACHGAFYFERDFCPRCGSHAVAAFPALGRGVVEAVTVVHRAPSDALRPCIPYAIVLVRMAEGFLVMAHGRIGLAIGATVKAEFMPFGELPSVPFFREPEIDGA